MTKQEKINRIALLLKSISQTNLSPKCYPMIWIGKSVDNTEVLVKTFDQQENNEVFYKIEAVPSTAVTKIYNDLKKDFSL